MLHRRETIGWLTVAMLFTGSLALSGATPEHQGPRAVAQIEMGATRIDWLPKAGDYESLILTVAGPGDFYLQRAFGSGETPSFSSLDAQGSRLPDGVYAYELRVVPRPDLKLIERPRVQSGHLWLREGSFVDKLPAQLDPSRQSRSASKTPRPNVAPKDIVQPDDLIVQGQACVGADCVVGDADESGVILKLREIFGGQIKFQAMNCCVPYARVWALQANDPIAGNGDFLIRDLTAATIPFRIGAGAPENALTVFFNGNVGLGTLTPAARLDVRANASGAAAGRVQNSSATGFSGFEYVNNVNVPTSFLGTDNANANTRFNSINNYPIVILTNSTERIRFPAPGGNILTAINGAFLSAGGAWTNASSRASKRDIAEISGRDALKALQGLNPVTFRYKEESDEQYAGFIAEDVPDLVATNDHKHLSSMDVVAVLTKVVKDQQKTIDELSARLADLEGKNK